MAHLAPSSPPLAHRDRTGNSISILNNSSPHPYNQIHNYHEQSPSSSSSRRGSSSPSNSDSESEEEPTPNQYTPTSYVHQPSSYAAAPSRPEVDPPSPSSSHSSDRNSERSSSPPTFKLPAYSKPYNPIVKETGRGGGRAVDLPLRRGEYEHALRNPADGNKNILRGWIRPVRNDGNGAVVEKRSREEEEMIEAKRRKLEGERKGDVAVVASHYNHRPEVGRENRRFSPIFGLKSFNNWVKSVLIAKFSRRAIHGGDIAPARNARPKGWVLDLGCGKGGDLLKWNLARVEMYIGFDIAEVSVQQASQRAQDIRVRNFDYDFHALDCFSVPITEIVTVRQPFDLVTMQFCIHYAFETEEKTRTMLTNVTRDLKKGGVFMGTVPNAEKLIEQLESIPEESDVLSFGNDVYSIEFSSRSEYPTYGHRYSFFLQDAVEDVPEYLVHWDNFEKLALEYGLRLIYKKEFHEIFEEEGSVPEFTELLSRMKVVNAKGESEMSEDQWEAANLYLGFAFEKI